MTTEPGARVSVRQRDYRGGLVERLRRATDDVDWALKTFPEDWLHREPGAGEWSVHKAISHLPDVEIQAYAPRLTRALDEDEPLFSDFNGTAWLQANYRPQEPLQSILGEFRQQREQELAILTGLTDQQWRRGGTHETAGRMTVEYLAERMYWHTLEHTTQVMGNRQMLGLES